MKYRKPGPPRSRTPDATIRRVREMLADNKTDREIMEETGCARSTINRINEGYLKPLSEIAELQETQ